MKVVKAIEKLNNEGFRSLTAMASILEKIAHFIDENKAPEWTGDMIGIFSIFTIISMSLSKLQKIVKDREAWVLQSMQLQRVGHDMAAEQQKYDCTLERILEIRWLVRKL